MLDYQRYKLSVSQYDRMVEVGILTKDDRIELIDGEMIYKPKKGPRHAACRTKLLSLLLSFEEKAARPFYVGSSHAIRLDEYSEVEPDMALLVRDDERFRREHPKIEDAFLLIEVTDLDPERNHQIKLPLYARTGARELWIVDFPNDLIELYREPSSTGFKHKTIFHRGDTISPQAFPNLNLSVNEILLGS